MGDRHKVNNYRPISLLCTLSKVLESIIYSKIVSFVKKAICQNQFGFLPNCSSLSQLLVSFNSIFKNIENGLPTDSIYFDFQKAFDSVPHSILLFKLWQLGITGPLWLWFQNYLTDRFHFVHIEGFSSTQLPQESPKGVFSDLSYFC